MQIEDLRSLQEVRLYLLYSVPNNLRGKQNKLALTETLMATGKDKDKPAP